jgi:ribosomal protein S18 acetylase RimI-like enzyme
MEWVRGEFAISTEESRLDLDMVHAFLRSSYWAAEIPYSVVERAVKGSLPFGVYRGSSQIGFARVITDCATFAYLADVFIDETYRGQGLGEWLIGAILEHPELQGLRRWMLVTRDAQGLYRKFGFEEVRNPASVMERRDPDIYRKIGH